MSAVAIEPKDTIAAVFARRVAATPDAVAYREFDAASQDWRETRWSAVAATVARMRAGLARENLAPGDRVAIMLRNCREWVAFDLAAHAQGLVVVPLFVDDRPENVAYILGNSGAKVLLVGGDEHLKRLEPVREQLTTIQRIVSVKDLETWMPAEGLGSPPAGVDGDALATIVYTSGTTGKPKGVMLSHQNMLQNVKAALSVYEVFADDVFLSFLPLSHMFERTVGYYLTLVAGAQVAFARSIPQLSEDFKAMRPTVIVSVPRIFERLHAAIHASMASASATKRRLFEFAHHVGWDLFQWHQRRGGWKPAFLLWPVLKALVASKLLERLGGRLRLCISGGAALSPDIARTFLGLGLPICQGYGLTEASPVVSGNRLERNDPASIGEPLPGIEVAFDARGALLVKGPNVMLGYWNNPEATKAVLSDSGWLDTGDQAKLENGFLYITGRLKDIIVLGNGEKVPPSDMEVAMQLDPLVEHALVVGEGKPYLAALVVLDMDEWFKVAQSNGLMADPNGENRDRAEKLVLGRIAERIQEFPGYAQIRKVALITDKWTVDNGLLTPTLKPKRGEILKRYADRFEALYRGH